MDAGWGTDDATFNNIEIIDVEVLDGPLKGQTVTTLFREVPGGTEVTQVNRVWPGNADMMCTCWMCCAAT